jgi:hypothetical protein
VVICEREVEDQSASPPVPVFSRQYYIILDLNITTFVSDRKSDFVNLDAVPCGSKYRIELVGIDNPDLTHILQ